MTAQQANNISKFHIAKRLNKGILEEIETAVKAGDQYCDVLVRAFALKSYEKDVWRLHQLGYKTKFVETWTSKMSRLWFQPATEYWLNITWGHA